MELDYGLVCGKTKEDIMTYYKSRSFVSSTIIEKNKKIAECKLSIIESEGQLEAMGIKLYRQFRSFVMSNKGLYDKDFIENLSVRIFKVTQVLIINTKSAVRLRVEPNGKSSMYVMVPLLFISDADSYKNARKRKVSFGAGATDDHIKKHYDGEIGKLQAEIDALNRERADMSANGDDWI